MHKWKAITGILLVVLTFSGCFSDGEEVVKKEGKYKKIYREAPSKSSQKVYRGKGGNIGPFYDLNRSLSAGIGDGIGEDPEYPYGELDYYLLVDGEGNYVAFAYESEAENQVQECMSYEYVEMYGAHACVVEVKDDQRPCEGFVGCVSNQDHGCEGYVGCVASGRGCEGYLCNGGGRCCEGYLCSVKGRGCEGALCNAGDHGCEGYLCAGSSRPCEGALCAGADRGCEGALCGGSGDRDEGFLTGAESRGCEGALCNGSESYSEGFLSGNETRGCEGALCNGTGSYNEGFLTGAEVAPTEGYLNGTQAAAGCQGILCGGSSSRGHEGWI